MGCPVFSMAEILYNAIWVFLLVVGIVITVVLLKKRDPYDDGPGLNEDE